jgi:hypothetical protein
MTLVYRSFWTQSVILYHLLGQVLMTRVNRSFRPHIFNRFFYSATFVWRELIGHSDPNMLFYFIYSATFLWRELIGHSDPNVLFYIIYSATFLWRKLIGHSDPKYLFILSTWPHSYDADMFLNVTYYDIVIMNNILTRKVFSFLYDYCQLNVLAKQWCVSKHCYCLI